MMTSRIIDDRAFRIDKHLCNLQASKSCSSCRRLRHERAKSVAGLAYIFTGQPAVGCDIVEAGRDTFAPSARMGHLPRVDQTPIVICGDETFKRQRR